MRKSVRAYPFMLYLGTVCGLLSAARWAETHRLSGPRTFAAMLLLFLPALVGARLLFVAFHWEVFRHQPGQILQRSNGGAALYGGLLLSLTASLPLLRALALPFWAFWDAAAIALLIGMIFTRAGCFLHGCCAGRPADSRFAFYLPDSRGVWRRRLPAQVFEAALAAIILLVSLQLAERFPFRGGLFLCSLAAYAAGRWVLEPTRETVARTRGWSLNRAISVALVLFVTTSSLVLWVSRNGAVAPRH